MCNRQTGFLHTPTKQTLTRPLLWDLVSYPANPLPAAFQLGYYSFGFFSLLYPFYTSIQNDYCYYCPCFFWWGGEREGTFHLPSLWHCSSNLTLSSFWLGVFMFACAYLLAKLVFPPVSSSHKLF